MPQKRKRSRGSWQLLMILSGILSFLGFLGELEISPLGRSFYTNLKTVFGSVTWLIPILFFIVMILAWILSHQYFGERQVNAHQSMRKTERVSGKKVRSLKQKNKKQTFTSMTESTQGISIPQSRLVTLKGFEEYFASPEGPVIESAATREDLADLGHDFSTYFQEGQEFSFQPFRKIGTKLTSVQGFSQYFDEVQAEFEEELGKYAHPDAEILLPRKKDWFNILRAGQEKPVPGQVAKLSQSMNRWHTDDKSVAPDPEIAAKTYPWQKQMPEPGPEQEPEAVKDQTAEPANGRPVKDQTAGPANGPEPVREQVEPFQDEQTPVPDPGQRQQLILYPDRGPDQNIIQGQTQGVNPGQTQGVTPGQTPNQGQNQDQLQTQELEQTPVKNKSDQTTLDNSTDFVCAPGGPKQRFWSLPGFDLLDPVPYTPVVYDTETQKQLERVLADFGVQAKVVRVTRGPVITRYELAPAPGVKISRIVNLADDIALGLAARDVRIEAPIPGKAAIGIEVPNKQPRPVSFREVLETAAFKEKDSKLKTAIGKDIADQPVIADLAKMPHLLIAGATGAGKSVCITAMINSLLYNARPDEVKFLMIDPKMVELSIYNGIPHLLAPVVTDPKKAAAALKWVVKEMETRYELFASAGVRDIERYNRLKAMESSQTAPASNPIAPALPWIVVIIDELADLMMVAAHDVEEAICRLAQMARAAGIHLVIATQRPSVDVITGVIKANIPSRISFAVSSQIDSRTILDATGAEKLLGRGDMLYSPQGLNKPMRVQGCYVSDEEVQRIIAYWKAQGKPEYLDPERFLSTPETLNEPNGPDDELFVDAGRMLISTGMASVSFLQRKFKLGYARAARLMDLLEENGIVGGYEGSKPRQILMTLEEFEERFG